MASAELSYTTVGEKGIRYARAAELGRGYYGIVYRGYYKDKEVAVKKIQIERMLNQEVKLQHCLTHRNILKVIEDDKDDDFRYIVLELCAGTLEQFIKNEYTGPMPSDREVLYQIACGVQYIHSMKLIHRDIKPGNILISYGSPVVMKVSDFGLSKPTSINGTFTWSEIKGTPNWIAPEILILNPNNLRGFVQSDIFATGCVFFYFIQRGTHPFGDQPGNIEENIRNGKPVNLEQLSREHFAYGLIENMFKKVKERISLIEVIEIIEQQMYQFKAIERPFPQSISGLCLSRFHPTEPVLACGSRGSSTVMILKAANGSTPFSNWEIEHEFKPQTQYWISALEWNVNGTQLAAGCADGTVIVWSYPSGDVFFEEKKHSSGVVLIAWNPFRQDVLATLHGGWRGEELLFWISRRENGDAEKANHFLTLERHRIIWSVAWTSTNQFAIALGIGEIEIWEIELERSWLSFLKTTNSRVIKQFRHSESRWALITHLIWNERTKCLASSSWNDTLIQIWSIDSDQPVHTLQVDSGCRRLAWRWNVKTDDGRGIDDSRNEKENFTSACGLKDGTVVIWNPLEEEDANRKRILPHKHPNRVESLSFSPDGQFLASADNGGELIIWSTQTWLPVFTCLNAGYYPSWMSTDSSSVPAYKLAVSSSDKNRVIEVSVTE